MIGSQETILIFLCVCYVNIYTIVIYAVAAIFYTLSGFDVAIQSWFKRRGNGAKKFPSNASLKKALCVYTFSGYHGSWLTIERRPSSKK